MKRHVVWNWSERYWIETRPNAGWRWRYVINGWRTGWTLWPKPNDG